MTTIKNILNNFNKKELKKYLIITIVIMLIVVVLGTLNLTQARYETDTNIKVEPNLAFFLVDVQSQSGQIKLDSMIPSTTPYLYTFNVSNFYKTKKANVDLKYTVEIITTTNMPLRYKIYKGSDYTTNQIDEDFYDSDENSMYYHHMKINDVEYLDYRERQTHTYTLWVEFPIEYKNSPDQYSGIIDLIDIKINAEQIV